MSWKDILKLDLSEASKLTQEHLPQEMSVFDSKGRKTRRNEYKQKVLGRIAYDIRKLESYGEFPQSKQFMKRYKKLEEKVRLSKPSKYGTEISRKERLEKPFTKDPYIGYLQNIMFILLEMTTKVETGYASYMA
tara:strand:+ start:56 stop:457 length:402 start_codon:yes stop_codon:yes gene_type:complete